jgi:peroxiredoxin
MRRLQTGDAAPDLTLPDHTGQEVRLGELWGKQPLVLLFLRHLG